MSTFSFAEFRLGESPFQSSLRVLTGKLHKKFKTEDGRGISRVVNAQADGHQR